MIEAYARYEMEIVSIDMPSGVFLKRGEPKPEGEVQVKWTPIYQITTLKAKPNEEGTDRS